MRVTALAFCAFFAGFLTQTAWPAVNSERAEAIAMVRLVQSDYKNLGAKATFQAITDKTNKAFHKGDLYPFVFTLSGRCVAHGASPALVGKNLIGLRDPDGKYLIRDLARLAQKGDGWYDYKWPDPATKLIENKSSYYSMLGKKYFVGVGIYKPKK